jgi:hypothetical protein
MNGQPPSVQARIAGDAAVRDYEDKQQKYVDRVRHFEMTIVCHLINLGLC